MRPASSGDIDAVSVVLPSEAADHTDWHPHRRWTAPGSISTTTVLDKEWIKQELARLEAQMDYDVLALAREYAASFHDYPPEGLFPYEPEGPLDPESDKFDARKWARAFYEVRTDVSEGCPPRTTGVAFRDLNVYGFGTATDFQKTVGNVFFEAITIGRRLVRAQQQRIDILHGLEGVVHSGEMLAVLGPPGSGCSTLLRTLAGDTHGFHVGREATINYQGIYPREMRTAFRGEAVYTAEVDDHFPHLTVGDTLYFAARARCPKNIPAGISRKEYAEHLRDVTMAMFGISHTKNTRVGNAFVRGVSGGERKRVTIAEAALSYSPLQCWDNSTRGLDSANAVEFCRTLRTQADVMGTTSCVAIYQAPQVAYELFDKVIVLYEGRQIFFGSTGEARDYFEGLGFWCPEQQTTADFLTSMTNPQERVARRGWESRVPRSPDEFADAWRRSEHRELLMAEMDDYMARHPFHGADYAHFVASRRADQSRVQRPRSPFTLSYTEQIGLTLWRNWVLLRQDPSIAIATLVTNLLQAVIVSSVLFNLRDDSVGMYRRGVLLFFVVIMNAFGSVLEILTMYAKRRVVDKHARYALYHPSAEAAAAMLVEVPSKILNAFVINTIPYFMGNLRPGAGHYFFFLLINFGMTVAMSMLFRLIGSVTKTISQALAPAAVLLFSISLYCGFAIPRSVMRAWLAWLRWFNPVYFGLQSVNLNEFAGRNFTCGLFIPSGPAYDRPAIPEARVCAVAGAVPGRDHVNGDEYLATGYDAYDKNRWSNFAVIVAFTLVLMGMHLVATEYVAGERSKGEVLVFTRQHMALRKEILPSAHAAGATTDVEMLGKDADRPQPSTRADADGEKGVVSTTTEAARPTKKDDDDDAIHAQSNEDSEQNSLHKLASRVEKHTAVVHWRDVCYEVKIKGETRRILDHVDGWIKPGTLTALMGVSGAGKTTLLDVIASRTTMGVITGEMLVDGHPRDESFQRKTGYVQQMDLHLHTSTVREALQFSALLRQPAVFSRRDKIAYVDTVIQLLRMEDYADAIIGIPGTGLNVEQRKRLTIGVELAARPQLLLFLDEPTSGLDSQTSWSILTLIEDLARNGQAVLCTIHQPSAMLFQRFDRLLLLAEGGRTVYFGEIGQKSRTMVDYFVRNGGPTCPPGANPAEYMLEVIGAAPGAHTDIDWPAVWRRSPEYRGVQAELESLAAGRAAEGEDDSDSGGGRRGETATATAALANDPSMYREFAAPWPAQFREVSVRVFQQYWRSPLYIFSKALLSTGSALFIGLSFLNAENTMKGLNSQMFGVFIFLTSFGQLVSQAMPNFVDQRTMYEARERPSKTYAWTAFMMANILVELFWSSVMSVFAFFCWYYPVGLYRNARWTDAEHSRGITMLLLVSSFFIYSSSFASAAIAGIETADVAGGISNLFIIMMFVFCGILATPAELPGFWIWMYRVNPFTYIVEGFLGVALANAPVTCDDTELARFRAPPNLTCSQYMSLFLAQAGGYLAGEQDKNGSECAYCSMASTNAFLDGISVSFDHRWRDFGLIWAFVAANVGIALGLYWLIRVPKVKKEKKA